MIIRLFPFVVSCTAAVVVVKGVCKSIFHEKERRQVEPYLYTAVFASTVLWLLYSVNQLTPKDAFVVVILAILFTTYTIHLRAKGSS